MKEEKTISRPRQSARSYGDACAAAHALDLVGDRWALLVVRELMLGPRRFTDLRKGLPGISANILTQRLEELEGAGIVVRSALAAPASGSGYELTEWGREAEPIFQALGRWGARSPRHDPTLPFSPASLVLSLRTMFDADRADGFKKRIGLRVDGQPFVARVRKGRLTIEPGLVGGLDCVLAGSAPVLASVIYGGASIPARVAEGALGCEGDQAVAEKFTRLFPLPDKAATP